MNRLKKWIEQQICGVRGHDWRLGVSLPEVGDLPSAAVTVCSRCGQTQLITAEIQIRDLGLAGAQWA